VKSLLRIISPVLRKELVQIANRPRTYGIRTLYLIGLSVLLGIFWAARGDPETSTPSETAAFGAEMFRGIVWVEFAVAALLTPAFTANLLVGEKRANTLGLLFMTRLRSVHIVQDKGLSRIAYMAQFLLLGIPFLYVCLMFGGVTTGQIATCMMGIMAMTLLGLGLSLFFSTLLSSYFAALSATYVVLFVMIFLFPIVIQMLLLALTFGMRPGGQPGFPAEAAMAVLLWTNPFYTVAFESTAGMRGIVRFMGSTWIVEMAWLMSFLFSLGVYGFSVFLSALVLPKMKEKKAAPKKSGLERLRELSALRILLRVPVLPFLLLAELLERRSRIRRNGVYWREAGLVGRPGRMAMVYLTGFLCYFYILIVVVAGLATGGSEMDTTALVLYVLSFMSSVLFLAVAAAASISTEREEGTLELLLSTRVGLSALVVGKFLGILRASVVYILPCLALGLLRMALIDAFDVVAICVMGAVMTVYFGSVAALGVFFSAASRTSMRAVGLTLLSIFVLCAGFPLAGELARDFLGQDLGSELRKLAMLASPPTWIIEVMDDPHRNVTPWGGEEVLWFNLLGWAVFAGLLLWAARGMLRWKARPH
jgi:ABC-type transport system involved in multi-copper enzyme maturation permease subunit